MSLIILTFHGVGPIPRSIDEGERHCWLERDYLDAVLDLVSGHINVRLTVDDGNASDFEIILPALLKRGLKATFFVCSGRLNRPAFLSGDQVRELRGQGMAIGSHGVSHLSWRGLPATRLSEEIEGSRCVLEEACGLPVDAAACPFGAYDRAVLKCLRRAGYSFVYTSDGGAAAVNHWLQPRTTVTRSMTLVDVQRLIQRGPGAWEQALIDVRKFIKRVR